MTDPIRFRIVGLLICCLMAAVLLAGGCSSAPAARQDSGVDEQFERLNAAARLAFDRGKYQQAASLYRQTLDRAYIRDDLAEIVDTLYNLAFCLMRLRSYGEALDRVQQSKDELSRAGQDCPLDILLLEAAVLHGSGRSDQAWDVTDQILSKSARSASLVTRKTHYLRGLIANQRGDRTRLKAAIAALGDPDQPVLQADLKVLQGYLAMLDGNWDAAITAFDETAELRRATLDYGEMAKMKALAAEACTQSDQPAAAAVRYLKAGRSAALQGEFDRAKDWLSRAEQLAAKAGDEKMVQEAGTYLQQVQESQVPLQD